METTKSASKTIDKEYFTSLFNLKEYDQQFYIENWLPSVEQFSAKTIYLNLEKEEANVIVDHYNHKFFDKNLLNAEKVAILKNLEKKIEEFLPNDLKESGFFFKFSFRSPTDFLSIMKE